MRNTTGRGSVFTRRVVASVVLTAGLLALAGCNLVIFDEDAVRAAREADGMKLRRTIEISEWDEYDNGVLLHPEGFLPDTGSSSSGYLVVQTEDNLTVIRVDGGDVSGRKDYFLESTRGAFQWSARVVPAAPGADTAYRPPLLIALAADPLLPNGEPSVLLAYPEPGGSGMVSTGLALAPILADEGFTNRVLAAVQAVSLPSGAGEIQILAWDSGGGGLQEYFVGVSGDELVRWDHVDNQSDPLLLTYSFSAGSATYPRPQRGDGSLARAISYGNARLSAVDPNNRRGYLTYADGDFTDAPLRTYQWLTDGAATPSEVEEWQYQFRSVTFDGVLRNALTGSIVTINARAATGSQTTEKDYGTLYYAGQYPTGDGTTLADTYTAVGMSRSVSGWTLTIAVYED
jgi:hypothetical protein